VAAAEDPTARWRNGKDRYLSTDDVISELSAQTLDGKRVLLTGPSSGIGKDTARALGALGAEVVCACRSAESSAATVDELSGSATAGSFRTAPPLDLSSLDSVRSFAAALGDEPLDVLCFNAGLGFMPGRSLTTDGHDACLGTNHLAGHLRPGLRGFPKLKPKP
jgi:NAD(P)-dependent dehydrogenase (short-subunit alcohol dehydrogenase family)